jgi:hypothetical protein
VAQVATRTNRDRSGPRPSAKLAHRDAWVGCGQVRADAQIQAGAVALTSLIAASASQDARFSGRRVRPGLRSPACSAFVHPFRFGSSLTSADTHLPACCHVSVREKHRRRAHNSSARLRTARPAPILAALASFDSFVLTNT